MSNMSSSSQSSSPTKPGAVHSDVLKPNPHPYAIKTTSTGILSRSSSTKSSTFQSQNHYVPSSPSPSPTKTHYPGHSERGSRHRYSRSLTDDSSPRPLPPPPEDGFYQPDQFGHVRQRSDSLSDALDDPMNPKSWTFEQLAANVPEIAPFVQEHEITGRAFLRFDEGVLDAYGVTQQWQRSLILSHSRQLRQSMLQNRIWPNSNPLSDSHSTNERPRSLSPSKPGPTALPNEEEEGAYLSSSSSISSTSSLTGRRKRRFRPNGRVNGMVASFERSTSPEKTQFRRDRSGSISSVEDNDTYFQSSGDINGRPLPLPPPPTGDYHHVNSQGPLLLPQNSTTIFPNSFPQAFNAPQNTGLGTHVMPHATGNGPQSTGRASPSRPLPATPLHPSLRPPPVLDYDDDDVEDEPAADVAPVNKANTSGEMTMDELISVLKPDSDAEDAHVNLPDHAFVNTDRRRGRDKIEKLRKKSSGAGAAAWEMEVGETVKHAPPAPTSTAEPLRTSIVDEELSIEELLALDGSTGPGASAWVDGPSDGAVRTMKRVGAQEPESGGRFGSISKGKAMSIGKAAGTERISLSAGRKSHGPGKKQARRVGELFSFPNGGVEEEERPAEEGQHRMDERRVAEKDEEKELERMREVERGLIQAEEEERQRVRQAAQDAYLQKQEEDIRADHERAEMRIQEAIRAEEERVRQEERLRELFHRQQRMEEENRRRKAEEALVKERQAREEAAAERHRQAEAEERLAASITENRHLLEAFRGRLEQVEQHIKELESTFQSFSPSSSLAQDEPKTSDPLVTDPNEHLVQRLRMIAAWALATPLGRPLASLLRGSNTTDGNSDDGVDDASRPTDTSRSNSKRIEALYPKTYRRYAFLFGVGMCAFMLRGLLRWGVMGVRGMGSVGARGVRGR